MDEPWRLPAEVMCRVQREKTWYSGQRGWILSPCQGQNGNPGQNAKVLLAELTSKNANVFYELGLAHALGKPVVLVSETMDDVPFDLQQLRVILYDKEDPAWGQSLRESIIKALRETLAKPVDSVPAMFRNKSILREKVRPERLNRGVFLATSDRLFFVTGTKGGCDKIWDEGVTKPYSHISLILLWLYHTHRPPLCRARKKKGDDSDPPQKWGVMRPRVGVQCGTPSRGSQGVAIVGIYPCGKARNSLPRRR